MLLFLDSVALLGGFLLLANVMSSLTTRKLFGIFDIGRLWLSFDVTVSSLSDIVYTVPLVEDYFPIIKNET